MRAIHTASLSLLAIVASGLAGPRPAAAESYTLTTLASFNGANGAFPHGRPGAATRRATSSARRLAGGANGLGTVFELAAGSSTITPLASVQRRQRGRSAVAA